MSIKSRYRYAVINCLISSFNWIPPKAKNFVVTNDKIIDELKEANLSPYKAAQFINARFSARIEVYSDKSK